MNKQMNLTDQLSPDICRGRHRGNENSEIALTKVSKGVDREMVLSLVKSAGSNGLTVKDACTKMGRTPNQISGRFTELKASRLIKVSGRRDGCGVHFIY